MKNNTMKMKDPHKPLDKYEEDLMKAIENDEFVSVPNVKKEIKRYASYAQAAILRQYASGKISLKM